MQPLNGGSALDAVTIVGSKYCVGAFDYIITVSRRPHQERSEQCLFLVADSKSNDVVLHNGKVRLGSVVDHQRAQVRKTIDDLGDKLGQDQVLVCYMPYVDTGQEWIIRRGSSLNVKPTHHIYERIARKFSDKYRKE